MTGRTVLRAISRRAGHPGGSSIGKRGQRVVNAVGNDQAYQGKNEGECNLFFHNPGMVKDSEF